MPLATLLRPASLLALLLALAPGVAAQPLDAGVIDPLTGEPVPAGITAPPADRPADESLGGGELTLRQYLPSGSTKLVRFIEREPFQVGGNYLYQDGGALRSVAAIIEPGDDPVRDSFVLPAQPADMVIRRGIAYAALRKSEGLLIVDVSDLSDLREVGRLEGRDLLSMAVAGDYAYAGSGSGGVVIYDVSDPANPAEIGTASAPGSSNGTFVAGATLYVATGVDGLRTFDLADPTSPAPLGHFATGGEFATFVVVRDSVAWLTGGFGLIAVDVSDPVIPVEIGRFGTDGETTYEITFDGDTAYLPGLDGLRKLDVSEPAMITETGFFPASQALSVAFREGPAGGLLLAERFAGLHVLNASGDGDPVEVGFFENAGFSHKAFFDGDLLYVTDLAGRLRILDTSDNRAFEIARIDVPPNTQEVFVAGDYAYVTDADFGGTGLTILDVSDPADPQIVGGYESSNQALGLDVIAEGDAVTVYLANGFSGLVVLDASDPANVAELGSFPIGANVVDVDVEYSGVQFGRVAYVVSFGGGMLTFDVNDLANIAQLDAEPSYGFLNAIDIAESLGGPVFVADAGTGQNGFLRVVDAFPDDIETVSLVPTVTQARDVAATDCNCDTPYPIAFVADDFFGLREFRDYTYENPEETAAFESADRGIGVAYRSPSFGRPAAVALAAGEAGVYLFTPQISITNEDEAVAEAFALAAPFPNPVRDAATLRFSLPDAADVTLAVYDVLGRRVATLAAGPHASGAHEVSFDAAGLPSGVYLARLAAGAHRATRRLVVVR